MHDTRLHTEIEHGWPELMAEVFAEASRRLKEAGVGLPAIERLPVSEPKVMLLHQPKQRTEE